MLENKFNIKKIKKISYKSTIVLIFHKTLVEELRNSSHDVKGDFYYLVDGIKSSLYLNGELSLRQEVRGAYVPKIKYSGN